MANTNYSKIITDGLWNNNQAIVALLGLCPLMAVTTNMVNGLSLGLATTLVLMLSNITVSIIRDWVRPEIRLPVFVLLIAAFVTSVELAMNAYFYGLYKILGIFIPLIVTNCAIIGRAEAFASKNPVLPALVDAISIGLGFTLILMLLGGMREMIGQGTLFAHAHLLLGDSVKGMTIHFGENFQGMLIAILPPGAFLGLGFIIAVKNMIDNRKKSAAAKPAPSTVVSEAV